MANGLKELLVGTIGLARLGREYADGVQCGKIDGDDFGIALSDVTIKASKTRSGHVSLSICTRSEDVQVSGNDVRGVFAVFYGALAAEFGETLDDGEPKPVPPMPDLVEAIKLLREIHDKRMPDDSAWHDATAALLAKYPVTP